MGVVRNQSIKNSINFYIGMMIGAISTVFVFPNVFNNHPEHWGLIQILVSYAMVISTFSHFGIPKIFIRLFPAIKEKGSSKVEINKIFRYNLFFLDNLIRFVKSKISDTLDNIYCVFLNNNLLKFYNQFNLKT